MKKGYFQYHFRTLIFIFLILPAVVPLFKPYVLGTADGLGHRFRLVAFNKSLSEGILRPRWSSEAAMSYGAPLFLFNYPLPYYIASAFLRLGFSVNTSGQLLAGAGLVLSGLFMYFAIKKIAGFLAGLAAAVAYTYAPYHLLMVYTYDAWGEITAFVFPPLILFFTALLKSQKKGFVGLSFSWAALILSHNVSAMMFAPVLLGAGFLISGSSTSAVRRQRLCRRREESELSSATIRGAFSQVFLKSFIIGVLITSFFWLPAIVLQNDMNYPDFLKGEAANRGIFFKSVQLQMQIATDVLKSWKTGYFDITAGWSVLFTSGLAVFVLIFQILKLKVLPVLTAKRAEKNLIIYFSSVLIFSVFLTNRLSSPLWNFFPLSYILYPTRLLFAASFAGSIILGLLAGKNRVVAITVIIFAIVQGIPFTKPYLDIFPFPDEYFYRRQTVTAAPTTKKNMLIREFLPKNADYDFLVSQEADNPKREELIIKEGEGFVYTTHSEAEYVKTSVNGKTNLQLILSRFYFPNWKAKVDGREVPVVVDQQGRMLISLPKGEHEAFFYFSTTPIERIGYILSSVGLFWVLHLGGVMVSLRLACHHPRCLKFVLFK